MDDSIISVKNLNKSFKVKDKPAGLSGSIGALFLPNYRTIAAVKNISFTVKRGEVVAFIGPNGAGKSTTIKTMTGLLFPTSGEIEVLGLRPDKQRTQLAFRIGSVFGQKSQLWLHLPAIDSFNLFSKLYELEGNSYRKRLAFLVDAFGIGRYLNQPVRKLSLGERMRCEIVASLLHSPQVLFLDEPTIGLDVIAKQQIRSVIKHLNDSEQVTIFLTSHDAGDIEALAERTMVINHGLLALDDSTENFRRRFINTKTVELVLGEEHAQFTFDEGKIIERGPFTMKVEVPAANEAIERLLHYATQNYKIKDINIFEPELENIIAQIYGLKAQGS